MATDAQHNSPVWAAEADSKICVSLSEYGMPDKTETLDVKSISDNTYLICCVPFFVDGIALGDLVRWDTEKQNVSLVKSGERKVIRIAATNDLADDSVWSFIHAWVEKERLFHEWKSGSYIAIDVPNNRHITIPAPLANRQGNGELEIEFMS